MMKEKLVRTGACQKTSEKKTFDTPSFNINYGRRSVKIALGAQVLRTTDDKDTYQMSIVEKFVDRTRPLTNR